MKNMFRKEYLKKNFLPTLIIPKRDFFWKEEENHFPKDTLGLKAFINFLVFIFCKNFLTLQFEGRASI